MHTTRARARAQSLHRAASCMQDGPMRARRLTRAAGPLPPARAPPRPHRPRSCPQHSRSSCSARMHMDATPAAARRCAPECPPPTSWPPPADSWPAARGSRLIRRMRSSTSGPWSSLVRSMAARKCDECMLSARDATVAPCHVTPHHTTPHHARGGQRQRMHAGQCVHAGQRPSPQSHARAPAAAPAPPKSWPRCAARARRTSGTALACRPPPSCTVEAQSCMPTRARQPASHAACQSHAHLARLPHVGHPRLAAQLANELAPARARQSLALRSAVGTRRTKIQLRVRRQSNWNHCAGTICMLAACRGRLPCALARDWMAVADPPMGSSCGRPFAGGAHVAFAARARLQP